MDKNDNEIKFIKNRSNSISEVIENFKKSNYYDAFYLYNRLGQEDRLALIPIVVEAYSKLKKSDYEAKALFEMLIQSDELKNVSAVDRKVVSMRLSEYYNAGGEKQSKVKVVPEELEKEVDSNEHKNIIMFEKLFNNNEEKQTNECKVYSKNNLLVDRGDYFCERATTLAMVKKYDEAIKVLNKIGEKSARYNDAQKLRTAILIDCGKFDEVVDVAIGVLKANPNEFIGLFALNICISMGKERDKIFDFLRNLEDAKGLQVSVLRARAFAEIDNLKKGIEILNSLESPNKYAHEALVLKAILYDGLGDKEKEESTLREIITIYPDETDARFLLSCLIRKNNTVSSRILGSKYLIDLIQSDLNNFIENELKEIEKLTIEEAEYYWNAAMKYGNVNDIATVTSAYYNSLLFKDVVLSSLVDINLEDTKKLIIIENLVFGGFDENIFALINGKVKKIEFGLSRELIFMLLQNENVLTIDKKVSVIEHFLEKAIAKIFTISHFLEIDIKVLIKTLEDYLLKIKGLENEELAIMISPQNIAFCICVLSNSALIKNHKIKKYLNIKNQNAHLLIDYLQKNGFVLK